MSKFTAVIPTRCIERHPTTQTVWFAKTPVNLSDLAASFTPPMDKSYLSRIFRGRRQPSLDVARDLARALGMQLQGFLDALEAERQD